METQLGYWLTLGGYGEEALEYFRAFTSHLEPFPAPAACKEYSRLCRDGSPVQFCETLAREVCGPSFTIDPGAYGATEEMRLKVAASLAAQALSRSPQTAAATDRLRLLVQTLQDREPLVALWLGYSPGQIRFHFSVNSHLRAATWRVMTASLPGFSNYSVASRSVLGLLAAHGYRTRVVLEISADGRQSTEVSFKLCSATSQLLDSAALSSGVPASPLHMFVKRILKQREGWQDVRARASFRISEEGRGEELTLLVSARRYFRVDEELRETVLLSAAEFGWDVSFFRPASRLLGSSTSRSVRSSLSISVSIDGATRLQIFSTTGHHASDHTHD